MREDEEEDAFLGLERAGAEAIEIAAAATAAAVRRGEITNMSG